MDQQLTKFSESSFQPHRNHDDESPLDTNPDTLNNFNADKNAENMDDWLDEQQIIELTQKNLSKISEAMAVEISLLAAFSKEVNTVFSQRPTWNHMGLIPSVVAGPSLTPSGTSPALVQGIVDVNPLIRCLSSSTVDVGGLTPTQSLGGSSQASSIDVPSASPSAPTTFGGSNLDFSATLMPGMHHLYVYVCLLSD